MGRSIIADLGQPSNWAKAGGFASRSAEFRAGTWKRYEGLLRLLDELGDKRVDAVGAVVVRAFMAELAKRGIQARGPVNLLRTILVAAVETCALGTLPELPKPLPPGRKLPSAPSTEEVEAMLGKAEGWRRVAIALARSVVFGRAR